MNRGFALSLALAAFVAVACAAPAEDKFTDKYDNINLDEILNNERLYKKYVECLLAAEETHCTADGKELRKAIPDALTNDCAKCNDKQRSGTEKVLKFLRANKPADMEKLEAKWDPEGIYKKKYTEKYADKIAS